MTKSNLGITVLICTHNRAKLLQRTLDSLHGAGKPSKIQITILVVLSACTDTTESMLASYPHSPFLTLHWVQEPLPGKSRALNRGLSSARSPVIALVDDDHRVDAGYLEALADATDVHANIGMFCGRIFPDWDGSEPKWLHDDGPYAIRPRPIPYSNLGPVSLELETGRDHYPGGGNLAIRRKVFDRVGGFSTELGPSGHNLTGGEDAEFLSRAFAAGEKLVYIPGMIQYHHVDPHRYHLFSLLRKSFQRSRTAARLQKKCSARFPWYAVRKTLGYGLTAAISASPVKRRYYLVRMAAALGEAKGVVEGPITADNSMRNPTSSSDGDNRDHVGA